MSKKLTDAQLSALQAKERGQTSLVLLVFAIAFCFLGAAMQNGAGFVLGALLALSSIGTCIASFSALARSREENQADPNHSANDMIKSAGIWASAGGWIVGFITLAYLMLTSFLATHMGHGRPLRRGRRRLLASLRRGSGWSGEPGPRTEAMGEEEKGRLADQWLTDALAEHSSIATFSHLALELMREGAPPDLIIGCHEAALDEIRHARTAFSFAAAYAGESFEAGEFPAVEKPAFVNPFLDREGRLADIAQESFIDGCIGEEAASRSLIALARRSNDDAVRKSLERMALEEHRHGELAWRIVEWAYQNCGDNRRLQLRGVFDTCLQSGRFHEAKTDLLNDCRKRLSRLPANEVATV